MRWVRARPGAAAADRQFRVLIARDLASRVLIGQHPEAGVGDHLEIRSGGLAFAGEVVAEEQGVGEVQCLGLQCAEVHLPAAGHPDLTVGDR